MRIDVIPWPGARTISKKVPVIVKCLTWGCIYLTVADSQATDQMLLVLLRLEQIFGKIELISRDMGRNVLIENLNPRIISPDHARLLGKVQEVQNFTDSQFRNYSERSTGMVKRYIREATKRVKCQALPMLQFSEWLFLLSCITMQHRWTADFYCAVLNIMPSNRHFSIDFNFENIVG